MLTTTHALSMVVCACSYMPLMIKAASLAISDYPLVNSVINSDLTEVPATLTAQLLLVAECVVVHVYVVMSERVAVCEYHWCLSVWCLSVLVADSIGCSVTLLISAGHNPSQSQCRLCSGHSDRLPNPCRSLYIAMQHHIAIRMLQHST